MVKKILQPISVDFGAQEHEQPIYRRNVNKCSHCKLTNLPEPIVFAKLCRMTGEYVCDGCYSAALFALIDMEGARS